MTQEYSHDSAAPLFPDRRFSSQSFLSLHFLTAFSIEENSTRHHCLEPRSSRSSNKSWPAMSLAWPSTEARTLVLLPKQAFGRRLEVRFEAIRTVRHRQTNCGYLELACRLLPSEESNP